MEFRHAQINDELTVKHPELGTEWRLDVLNEVVSPLQIVIGFKLKRLARGEFLFMLAKDYTVPQEHVISAEELLTLHYPRTYAKMFANVAIDGVRELGDGQWEADYRLEHATMGVVLKRERVKTVRRHVLLASAEGWPKDMEAHSEVVARWLTATYAPLDR